MNLIPLSTEQAPPISIPLRFFAVAPLFLALAALVLAFDGGNPFDNLHNPALLAATHCITLGFISMAMLGAMQQLLPVVIGSTLPAPRLVAWSSQLLLVAGTLLLCFGFMLGKTGLFTFAWPLLGAAFAIFISASLFSIARAAVRNDSKTAMVLAILALGVAVILGMLLAHGYAGGRALDYPALAAAHISTALGGWVMLLVAGVSYQVVPMFQLTPAYPKWLTASLAPVMFATLALHLTALLFEATPHWFDLAAQNLFWLYAIVFSSTTLVLQYRRRRSIPDATLAFFRLGMGTLLCLAFLSLALQGASVPESLRIMAGILFIVGFTMSLIFGMLYKIVPFLVWFHLFRSATKTDIPNMKIIIPEVWMWRHFWLHGCTLATALLSLLWPVAAWLFMLCLVMQSALFSRVLYGAIALYRHTLRKIEQEAT